MLASVDVAGLPTEKFTGKWNPTFRFFREQLCSRLQPEIVTDRLTEPSEIYTVLVPRRALLKLTETIAWNSTDAIRDIRTIHDTHQHVKLTQETFNEDASLEEFTLYVTISMFLEWSQLPSFERIPAKRGHTYFDV